MMEVHLKITGSLLIILAILHFIFPKYFNWKEEFSSVSVINRQMMYIHSYFIAFIVFLIGLLCLAEWSELLTGTLGKRISLVLGIFWMVRLYVQVFGYSSRIWRGKAFETIVHILLLLFWTYVSAVFILAYFA